MCRCGLEGVGIEPMEPLAGVTPHGSQLDRFCQEVTGVRIHHETHSVPADLHLFTRRKYAVAGAVPVRAGRGRGTLWVVESGPVVGAIQWLGMCRLFLGDDQWRKVHKSRKQLSAPESGNIMKYGILGNSGAVVSNYALGTMTFGAESIEEVLHAILDGYAAAGGDFIDTADLYSAGLSEAIIGRWLAQRPETRDQMVVDTKGRFPMGAAPNDVGIGRAPWMILCAV